MSQYIDKAAVAVLQDSKTTKTIELGGIIYKPVPAKTNDKICKDCHYFLDNGNCTLEECPCGDDELTILERVNDKRRNNTKHKDKNISN